jgi:uncharacterized membrane protein
MQVLQAPFTNFVVPDPAYTGLLLALVVVVTALLYVLRPPVTQTLVVALTPWMMSGAALHVFYLLGERFQRQVFPPLVEPFFSAPAVYLTTFVLMGAAWVVSIILGGSTQSSTEGRDYIAYYLGATGTGIVITLIGLLIWQGLDDPLTIEPVVPVIGVVATMILTFIVYVMLGTWRTYIIAEARHVGALVLFAHLLDGVTTALGADVLGITERSVLPARIMEFAGTLPTAEYIGVGWLFLVVKLLLAVLIVVVFADYVSESPNEGNLFFAIVVALGLGPAMNNLFLFLLGLP